MSWNPVQTIDIRENLAGFKGDRINLSEGNGFGALICGDNTNDVGALKKAHVGVALLFAIPNNTPAGRPQSIGNTTGAKGTAVKRNSNLRQ